MSPGENEQAFATTAIQQRGEWLVKELAKLKRHPGEESIHDTRVQSRRMRAALEAFQDLFPSRQWQDLYDSIRRITRALGETRETEVMLCLLDGLTSADAVAENLCREYLDEKLQKKLKKLKKKLNNHLRQIELRVLRTRIRHLLGKPEATAENPAEKVRTASGPRGAAVLADGLDRARRIASDLAQPILEFRTRYFPRASDRQLHKLRIAAKKLRYAMEIFDVLWPGGLQKEIALARAAQDAAGIHQDWAVLKLLLKNEIRQLTSRNRPYLVSQAGRLLVTAEGRKAELRKAILPAVTELQTDLQLLLKPG